MEKSKMNNSEIKNILKQYNMNIEHKFKTFRLRNKCPVYAPKMKPEHYMKLPSYEWCKYIWVDENDNEVPFDYQKCMVDKLYFKKNVDYFPHGDMWKKRLNKALVKTNCGVACGKINNLVVLDLDFYKDGDEEGTINIFNEKFGTDYKVFDTYTVRTGSGGWHLYFKYDPDIKQTTNAETSVDIRNDGGYVVSAGTHFTTSDGTLKEYKVEHDATIKTIPPELKQWCMDNLYKGTKVEKKQRNPKVKVHNPITLKEEEKHLDEVDLGVYTFDLSDKEIEDIFCRKIPDMFFHDREHFVKWTTAMKTLNKYDLYKKWALKRCEQNYEFEQYEATDIFLKNQWDYIKHHNTLFCVEHIAKKSTARGSDSVLSYTKYKPTECHNEQATISIDRNKLGIRDGEQVDFIEEFLDDTRCLVVRSDTGTGKTTAMKKYMKNQDCKFISIVSRISLGKEQNKVFQEGGLDCNYWEEIQEEMDENNAHAYYFDEYMKWEHCEGRNICITIDSLIKLANFHDFHGYTLYLDEFNSLVEYFITCGNMNQKRVQIYKLLCKMMKQCDNIVCTDADISDNCLLMLKQWNIEYKYVNNTYKHNNNIKATELHKFDDLIEELKNRPKWMCCADSKTMVDIMERMGNDCGIKTFTSEYSGDIDLDAYDKVIFSPKIVYGLDSTMERPVFCYYKCHTITPAAMVQQICRNRNITELFYHFAQAGKWCNSYKYHNPEECKMDILGRDKYGANTFKVLDGNEPEEYVNLLAGFLYNYDCYDTNKFAHFINIIRSRGFITERKFQKTDDGKDIAKEIKEMKMEKGKELDEKCDTFHTYWKNDNDIEERKKEYQEEINDLEYKLALPFGDTQDVECLQDALQYEQNKLDNADTPYYSEHDAEQAKQCGFSEGVIKLNEILKIPFQKINMKSSLFYDPKELEKHWGCSAMFFDHSDKLMDNIIKEGDFNSNKSTSIKSQVILCRKFKKMIGLEDNYYNTPLDEKGYFNEEVIKPLDKQQLEKFAKEYKTVFRYRGKDFEDLTDKHTCIVMYAKMMKTICGDGIVEKQKTTKDGEHHAKYKYNMENVMTQYNIIKYRKNMDENMVDNIKSFSKPIYDSWMKAYKKPLTSKQKQDKNDKEIIDWMKQFKHPTKLFI
jgi:hypothetical protein